MKKFLKITGVAMVVLVVTAILLPFLFKGKIKSAVEQEMDQSLNARVSFDKVSLSLIRHFPDLTLSINHLTIKGKEAFSNDTLIFIPSLRLSLNLLSVVQGRDYEIKRLTLKNPDIRLKVLEDGRANWDIVKDSGTSDTSSAPSAFRALLQSVKISDGKFIYDDAEIKSLFSMKGINGELSGDMTISNTRLDVDASADEVLLDYEGIRYANNLKAVLKTKLDADIDQYIFRFKDAALLLNGLGLVAEGMFAMPDDGYDMDFTFKAKEDHFKAFLSLIPAIYAKDFDQVTADGKLSFSGFVKGKYADTSMPAFGLDLQVNEGSFSYPGLPGKVSDINVVATINNPDGNMDHTLVDVSRLHLSMMNNPVDAQFTLKTPVSDPEISGVLKGIVRLGDLAAVYPLGEQTRVSGTVKADVSLSGKMSSLEQGKYDQFKAAGFAVAENIEYISPQIPQPLGVRNARLDFSPAFVSLSGFAMTLGKNDLAAEGKISNYLPFMLKKDGILQGSLTASSSNFDLNTLSTGSSSASATDTSAMTAIAIPGGIDFTLNTSFANLVYDKYRMQNVKGRVRIKDHSLVMEGLSLDMLGGNISVAGTYYAADPGRPLVNMDIKLKGIDVKETYETFNTIDKLAPIARSLKGEITTSMKFSGELKKNMTPELQSVSAAGIVVSEILSLENNFNTLSLVADILKLDKLRRPAIEKVNLSWDLVNGMATVKPTEFLLGRYKSAFSGTISLDQSINFILNMDIPRSEFGGQANGVLTGFMKEASKKGIDVKLGDMVPVTLLIGGTVTHPKVSAGFKQVMTGMADDLKQQALEQLQAKKEEAVAKAREKADQLIEQADARAEKILEAARQQSENILRLARSGADKVKSEADSLSNRLIAEGKKNGMIAELAARKSAEKLKKEADIKAAKILDEARQRSDAILEKARFEAGQVKQEAKTKIGN